jgi:tRNA pseudouridine55 synthase
MFGLLNLNKPAGVSSAGVLGRLKRMVRPDKIGHAGTLDPLASGVLVACIGTATRLVDYVQQMPKQYRATFQLGRSSPSEDIEREITELIDPPIPSLEELQRAAAGMVGEILQRPPAFSALKVDGKRAYQLARAGREVELEPRAVTIHALDVVSYEYPTVVLDMRCSSGTYVRSLGRDLAESLGTAAVMSELKRTAIGPFAVAEACDPRELTPENLQQRLLPAIRAVPSLTRIELTDAEIAAVIRGLPIERRAEFGPLANAAEIAAVDAAGELVSLVTLKRDCNIWPTRNFRT